MDHHCRIHSVSVIIIIWGIEGQAGGEGGGSVFVDIWSEGGIIRGEGERGR